MSEYAVTISCKLNDEDTNLTTIVLDSVDDSNVSLNSSITSSPLVTGDVISDHMYKEPITYSFSGVLSHNGSKTIVVDKDGSRLSDIQEIFEKIKNNGILCTIVKIKILDKIDKNEAQFKIRNNMVLQSISWTEKINSLGFTFSFKEIMTVDIQEPEKDISDNFLPNVTDPNQLSFTDALLDWEQVDVLVIKALDKYNLIEEKFKNFLQGYGIFNIAGIVGATLGFALAGVIAKSIGIALSTIGPIGALIGTISLITLALVNFIKKKTEENKYRVKVFEYYKDDKKNQAEVKRFVNFIGDIHKQISKLNDYIQVFNISSNEIQECLLGIDNIQYNFKFEKNNTTNEYTLKVLDIDDNLVKNYGSVISALTDISQCTSSNAMLRVEGSGTYVYLMRTGEDKSDLTSYNILTSTIKLENYVDVLTEIIDNALLR